MTDRNITMVVIADTNTIESREMLAQMAEYNATPKVVLTPQSVRNIIPGIRANPAVGVLFWATDLQGLAADVTAFASYIQKEDEILAALNEVGVETQEG